MFVADLVAGRPVAALELAARFAAARQEMLAHNIANADTPGFLPRDVAPREFQAMLRRAIDDREHGAGDLVWRETSGIKRSGDGLRLEPRRDSGNILFHDRNNRDLERMMADLSENLAVFRLTTDLLRSRYGLVNSALAERV